MAKWGPIDAMLADAAAIAAERDEAVTAANLWRWRCQERDAEIAALKDEVVEARRRRDAWRARAENHVEIVNALRAKTAGQDSRTLGRALLGAAKMELEARERALVDQVARLTEQLWQAQERIRAAEVARDREIRARIGE